MDTAAPSLPSISEAVMALYRFFFAPALLVIGVLGGRVEKGHAPPPAPAAVRAPDPAPPAPEDACARPARSAPGPYRAGR